MSEIDVIRIDGCIQKDEGDFTAEEVETFTTDFLEWLTARHLGFGGALGAIDEEGNPVDTWAASSNTIQPRRE